MTADELDDRRRGSASANGRGQSYVDSPSHAGGSDLDTLVEWADPQSGRRRGRCRDRRRPRRPRARAPRCSRHGCRPDARDARRCAESTSRAEGVRSRVRRRPCRGAALRRRLGRPRDLPHRRPPLPRRRRVLRRGLPRARSGGPARVPGPGAARSGHLGVPRRRVRARPRPQPPAQLHRRQAGRCSPSAPGFAVERSEVFEKRHDFGEWCERQSCSAETVAELNEIAADRPAPGARVDGRRVVCDSVRRSSSRSATGTW